MCKLRQTHCSKGYQNDIAMTNMIPFAGKASATLGTGDIFSSGTGFLGTSGTMNYNNIK